MSGYFFPSIERKIHIDMESTVLPNDYGSKMFRVNRVTEYLQANGEYRVTFEGPIVTIKGADHTSNFGESRFPGGYGPTQQTVEDIPDQLRKYLAGPDALRVLLPPDASHVHDYSESVDPQPVNVGFPDEEQYRCECGATRWYS